MNDKNSTNNAFSSKPEHSKVLQLKTKNPPPPSQEGLLTHFLKVQYELNNQLFNNQILLNAYLLNTNSSKATESTDKARANSSPSELILQNEG